MLERNGLGFYIEKLPGRKRPDLCLWDKTTNVAYKVATFESDEMAKKFSAMVKSRFLLGLIDQSEKEIK